MPNKSRLESDPKHWCDLVYTARKAVVVNYRMAEVMGISHTTHATWLKKGKEQVELWENANKKALKISIEANPYFQYLQFYTRAGKEMVEELTGNLFGIAKLKGKGQANAAVKSSIKLLEYIENDSYGEKRELSFSGDSAPTINLNFKEAKKPEDKSDE